MERTRLTRARAWLAHAARNADGAWLAGITLLVLAAALHWGGSAALRAKLARATHDADAVQRQALQAGRERERRQALSPAARLEEFYRFFPREQSAPEWLERIQEAADRQKVQLAIGDYRMVRTPGSRLLAYQVTYPIKGNYSQVRRFLAQVLRSVPNASLDEVAFRRDAIGQGEVQATVRLTIHLKEGT